jgi:hypothetical protein
MELEGEPVLAPVPVVAPQLPEGYQCLTEVEGDLDKQALRYLMARGVTLDQIRYRGIGVTYIGRFAYRIIFPVREAGKLMAIVARDFTGQQTPKYLNSIGEKSLYGSGQPSARIILSEGAFKSLRIGRLGTGFSSMALLGKTVTETQQEQLKRFGCKEIVLWPDPDYPGRKGAIAVADKLTELGYPVGIVWPLKQAPDEEPLEEMKESWQRVEGYSWGMRQRLLAGNV